MTPEESTFETPSEPVPTTSSEIPANPSEANLENSAPPEPELALIVEAILLTTDRPLTISRIAELIPSCKNPDIVVAIESLNAHYQQTNRSFRIVELAGGWQIMTLPRFAKVLGLLHKSRSQAKLTPAALETLAIVAYKQPVLRAEIETIRGVASGETLRSLMERRLVRIVGRAEEIGRPMLYGTTRLFLEMYGLASLKDLPKVEDLKQPV